MLCTIPQTKSTWGESFVSKNKFKCLYTFSYALDSDGKTLIGRWFVLSSDSLFFQRGIKSGNFSSSGKTPLN